MRRDYEMVRGSDLVVPTRVARNKAGTIINLTGASVIWRIGPANRLSTDIQLDENDGVTIVVAASGTYSRILTGALTLSLEPGHYRHTVKVTESGGAITLVEQGYIGIERNLP